MNDKETAMIPYFAHEGEMARMERANKRLWIVIILLIVCLVGSNLAWTIYESQFQDVVVTQENESAPNSYIGNDGDITYGQANNQNPGEP